MECCARTSHEAEGAVSKCVQPTVMLGKCCVVVLSVVTRYTSKLEYLGKRNLNIQSKCTAISCQNK